MLSQDFSWGFITGFVAAGVFGYIFGRIRLAQKKMGAAGKPQTVSQKTDKTPRQVVNDSIWGTLSLLFWLAVFIAVLGGAFYWLIEYAL